MLSIYDRFTHEKLDVIKEDAILSCVEKKVRNGVSTLTFSVPREIEQVEALDHYQYVQWLDGDWYILLDIDETEENGVGEIAYSCEHAITSLLKTMLEPLQPFQSDNMPTRWVIEKILALQPDTDWELGDCEFERRFSYGWNNEALLRMLLYVPTLFHDAYTWEFDTKRYPWTVHLRQFNPDAEPEYYIRENYNLISATKTRKGREICTRLNALGAGDGINQLTFSELNDGKPYVVNEEGMAKYGRIDNTWEDGRFENEESMLARARQIAFSVGTPKVSRTAKVAELEKITGASFDQAEPSKIVQWNDFKTFIVSVTRNHVGDGEDEVEFSNSPDDIAQASATLADKARIAAVYGHGATNIWVNEVEKNCGPNDPGIVRFLIPQEMINANRIIAYWEATYFESYTKGLSTVQTQTRTSSGGGGGTSTSTSTSQTSPTSSVAGQQADSTQSGGQSSNQVTSGPSSLTSSYVNEVTVVPYSKTDPTTLNYDLSGKYSHTHEYADTAPQHRHDIAHTHTLSVTVPAHSHGFTTPAHSHSTTIPGHNHNVSVSAHTHDTTIPAHNHNVEYGIFRGGKANAVTVTLDDAITIPIPERTDFDILPYLSANKKNIKIAGRHRLTFRPDTLTGIYASVQPQIFIRSE